ncbi:hypothetical protein QBC37DRAFT_370631 [Rhypophila decipiens]|uniref:Uncharacterized protein n=1 Tax=Rhypophila decipiens TaxID=261697 RepID=A0AAN7BAN7_9PEZI|nr:hypothetical protein QBC37DRAFT_370631 [Rhypophila decipiens]
MGNSWSCDPQQVEVPLEPNADISGIWVLINLIGTAHLMVLVTFLSYIFAFDPAKDPYASTPTTLPDDHGQVASLKPPWRENPSLVTLCDVQLLTGLALQITIYYLLPSGLSAYHWKMAVLLTWFANVKHLSGLTSLRKYLYLHQNERNLRVIFMALFSAILLVSMVPTVFFNWHNSLDSAIKHYTTTHPGDGRPRPVVEHISNLGEVEVTAANASSAAICYFNTQRADNLFQQQLSWNLFVNHNHSTVLGLVSYSVVDKLRDTTAFQSTLLSILLLVFGAATRSIKIFKPSSLLFRNIIRNLFSRWTKRIIISGHQRLLRVPWARREIEDREPPDKRKAAVLYFYTRPMVAAMVVGRLYADFYSSMLAEVYGLIISVTWGDLRLATLRKSVSVEEDEITAGQFLPILLFIGPILSSVVTLWPAVSSIGKSRGPQQRAASPTPDTTTQSLVEPPPEREQSARPSTTDPGIELQVLPTNNRPTSTPQSNRNQEQTPSIHDLLEMDYSQQKWTDPLLVMPCIQILMLTVYILSAVYNTETSAWRVFQAILLWVLWIHPGILYCYVLLAIVYKAYWDGFRGPDSVGGLLSSYIL